MRHHFLTLLCAVCLVAASCNQQPLPPAPADSSPTDGCPCDDFFGCCLGFETGNLIFVADTTGMGSAIYQSTGLYTHVAVVVCEDSGCYVYEALPSTGVIRSRFNDWADRMLQLLPDTNMSLLDIAHFTQIIGQEYDTDLLVQRLHESLGRPYDPYFLSDNGMFYCSELIYECFLDKSGNHIFRTRPMNFRSADGSYPAYWRHHFDSLGVPIPQGLPGTNPTDLRKEPFLFHFKIE